MGEILFKKVVLILLFLLSSFLFVGVLKNIAVSYESDMISEGVSAESNSITGFAVHPLYSGFSSASNGFIFNNNNGLVSVSDTAMYKIGYYSINGGTWQNFTLAGASYNGDTNWISGSSSYTLPVFGAGEHYVIMYSCSYSGSWDCHDNKWQLIVINNSDSTCSGVTCKSGYHCSNGACLLDVPGNTYFVAPWGNDNNPGNFSHPWGTWGKALRSPSPGDIVYFRGGVYPMTVMTGMGYNDISYGNALNLVYFWAYPTDYDAGNVPILDCANVIPTGDLNHGIYGGADYVHFKGLTVRNVFQSDASDEAFGWRVGGLNTTFELCVAYNIHGVGFRASTNSTNMRFINCDAYNIVDYLDEAPLPGNDGYGFQVQNTQTSTGSVYYYGCRAWNCSDDGFTLFSKSYIEIDNSWSFSNGALEGAGNGWKLGFLPDGGNYPALTRKVTNSIAAYNRASGFTSNDNNNEAVTMQLYNNIVYHNGYSSGYPGISPGFYLYNTIYPDSEELKRVLKNNLGHANEDGPVRIAEGALYTHDHNSWDSSVTVSDEDFVLLPETQEEGFALLSGPRKADGSLPDLGGYFQIAPGSDLIDAGTIVSGHHCSTVGAHPGQNCKEWYGNNPDMGPFEYMGESPPVCVGSSSQVCSIANGVGSQSRTCVGGVWSAWGTCTVVSCNSGYNQSGNTCVAATCVGSSSQACSILNGVGSQSRTCVGGVWSAWGTCTVVSCNSGYNQSGNTCVAATCVGSSTQACSILNGVGSQSRTCVNGVWSSWGSCTLTSCNTGYTPCGNGCNLTSRSCSITNGVGNQTGYCSSGTWYWNACTVASCNSCYTPSGNTCVAATCSGSSTQTCSITNGVGSQSRTCSCGVWSAWSTCTLTSCNSCYVPSGNTCVAATCSGSSTQTCSITNGVGSQSRTCSCGVWSSWGTCTVVSCNSGYTPSGNTCVVYTPPAAGSTFIVNHSHTNITAIPVSCINKVKSDLHIAYAHTSHGSQVYTGLQALEQYNPLYGIDANGANGELHFEDYYYNGFAISGACYDLSNCDNGGAGLLGPTRTFLNEARGQDINVILWSWCAIGGHNMPFYLDKMQTIMNEYENGNASHPLPVKFVFITGHAEFGGVGDPADYANTIIRNFVNNQSANAFCKLHQCILFDFSDMENYDPDNNYYLDKRLEDGLQYDCIAPYTSGTKTCTWSIDYLAKYPNSLSANLVNNYISSCAHSPETGESPTSELNCALKGQAAWWMFARMVGWDGNPANGC